MAATAGPVRSRRRRSARFKMKIPLRLRTLGGLLLTAETTCVSKHGAHIRMFGTSQPLCHGDQLQLVVGAHQQQQLARVVWIHPANVSSIGIEVEGDGDLWGIRFPSSNTGEAWRPANNLMPEPKLTMPSVTMPAPVAPASNQPALPVAARLTPSLPKPFTHACAHPAERLPTLHARITGLSAVRLPLSESVEVAFTRPDEANVLLRNLVEPGAMLRLLFGNGRVMMGRVASIGSKRDAGMWRVQIKCDAPSC